MVYLFGHHVNSSEIYLRRLFRCGAIKVLRLVGFRICFGCMHRSIFVVWGRIERVELEGLIGRHIDDIVLGARRNDHADAIADVMLHVI